MNTDTKQQIETALRAFSGPDLRTASIGLLSSLGYGSEKILHLDNTPNSFLAEFDKRDREFRKDKALLDRWKSIEFLFQITDDEVQRAGGQAGLNFQSGFDARNFQSYLFFALDIRIEAYCFRCACNQASARAVAALISADDNFSSASSSNFRSGSM